MKKKLSEYEKEMNQEIENRLSLLDNENYDFGKVINSWDWFFVGIVVLTGLAIILYGAF